MDNEFLVTLALVPLDLVHEGIGAGGIAAADGLLELLHVGDEAIDLLLEIGNKLSLVRRWDGFCLGGLEFPGFGRVGFHVLHQSDGSVLLGGIVERLVEGAEVLGNAAHLLGKRSLGLIVLGVTENRDG
jgi:hypothetical protein